MGRVNGHSAALGCWWEWPSEWLDRPVLPVISSVHKVRLLHDGEGHVEHARGWAGGELASDAALGASAAGDRMHDEGLGESAKPWTVSWPPGSCRSTDINGVRERMNVAS
jgi:hypothetical protein